MVDSQQLMAELVSTYCVLNLQVRMQTEQDLQTGIPSARQLAHQMRDRETRFSQDLKARISGQPVSFVETGEMATLGMETDHDSTASLIAQFGTARESTLAMLRDLPEDLWDMAESSARSIRRDVAELIERDHRALGSIADVLSVSTG